MSEYLKARIIVIDFNNVQFRILGSSGPFPFNYFMMLCSDGVIWILF